MFLKYCFARDCGAKSRIWVSAASKLKIQVASVDAMIGFDQSVDAIEGQSGLIFTLWAGMRGS